MAWVFAVKDVTGRRIHLSAERWAHISRKHPDVVPYLEEIPQILRCSLQRREVSSRKVYYAAYFKHRPFPEKFLVVIGKYLNDHGFILTAYFALRLP